MLELFVHIVLVRLILQKVLSLYSFLLVLFKIRLCALNDDSSEESDHEPTQESVKQAKVGDENFMASQLTKNLISFL